MGGRPRGGGLRLLVAPATTDQVLEAPAEQAALPTPRPPYPAQRGHRGHRGSGWAVAPAPRSIVHRGIVHRGTVHRGTVHRGTVHRGTVHRGTVHRGTVHRGTVHRGTVHRGHRQSRYASPTPPVVTTQPA